MGLVSEMKRLVPARRRCVIWLASRPRSVTNHVVRPIEVTVVCAGASAMVTAPGHGRVVLGGAGGP